MRALFVVRLLAAVVWLVAPGWVPASAMRVQPTIGERVTQADVFGYLFAAPGSGDWLSYRFSHDGRLVLTKSVGFGSDGAGPAMRAYFETKTQLQSLAGSPVHSFAVAGGSLVAKMYVDAADFSDVSRRYSVVTGAVRVGDATFRLDPARQDGAAVLDVPLQTLLLSGALPLPDQRLGTVVDVSPEDTSVEGRVVHCVHVTVDFPPSQTPGSTTLPAARLDAWQSPDVPLGTVAWKTTLAGDVFDARLVAFGRASYRPMISSDPRGGLHAGYQR